RARRRSTARVVPSWDTSLATLFLSLYHEPGYDIRRPARYHAEQHTKRTREQEGSMIVDIHAHYFPKAYNDKLLQIGGRRPPEGAPPAPAPPARPGRPSPHLRRPPQNDDAPRPPAEPPPPPPPP